MMTVPGNRSTLAKIRDFPLIAMVIGIAAVLATIAATGWVLRVLPGFGREWLDLTFRTVVGVGAVGLVYKLVVPRIGSHRKDDLPLSGSVTDTLIGLGVGAGLMTLVVGIAAVAGAYRVLGWGGLEDLLEIVLVTGVVAGVIEEILIRGIVFRFVEEIAGSAIALAVSALLFGVLHMNNPNATIWSSICIGLEAGVLLGGAYMLTRSLWLAIGLHAGWNITQGFVWNVPVSGNSFVGMVDAGLYGPDWLSGGAFGLEASVIALVVAGGAGVWIVRQAKKAGHWVRPSWAR
ncbi:MAG: CPBP family intramembrane glutamic endopeptidase [Pontixanthobacter sp.]